MTYVAYAPRGALARGAELAKTGGNGQFQPCSACHGAGLTGGDQAPPLVGGEFTSEWEGLTVDDLFERIRTSMPQDAPGSLTAAQYADITAYLMDANKLPAGQTELPKDATALQQIKWPAKPAGK